MVNPRVVVFHYTTLSHIIILCELLKHTPHDTPYTYTTHKHPPTLDTHAYHIRITYISYTCPQIYICACAYTHIYTTCMHTHAHHIHIAYITHTCIQIYIHSRYTCTHTHVLLLMEEQSQLFSDKQNSCLHSYLPQSVAS